MVLRDDIHGETYKKLIRYAMSTSDAVMTVYCEKPDSIETAEDHMARALKFMPSFRVTRELYARWKAREWEEKNNMILCHQQRQPFIESMEPYKIKQRHDTQWPSTEIIYCNTPYTVAVYRVCEEIYPLLLKPGSYLAWRYPRYPEDLSFFKNNRCWLYASSHEEYIEFLPCSQEEYDAVASLGIDLPEPYQPIEDGQYYREEYHV